MENAITRLSVAVMVSVDKRKVYQLFLPRISQKSFRGVSLAELLDDVAIHLMETIPEEHPSAMPRYAFCPNIELRRVKVSLEIPLSERKFTTWEGRFAVVVTRWPEDDFYTVTVPRMGTASFAVKGFAELEAGLGRFLLRWLKDAKHHLSDLASYTCASYDYLEILEIEAELPSILPSRQPPKKKKKKKKKKSKDKKGGKDKKKTADKEKKPRRRLIAPRTLRQVGANLSHRAVDGRLGQAFGRDLLVEQLQKQVLKQGAAILLVGPSGVGKTAVVEEVVRRLAARELPLQDRTDVWGVDGNRIIAGMSVVGAWEQRCKNMVEELQARRDILYVADLPALVYTGRSSHSESNVAEYLEPHIARGDITIIGECTPERLEATREEAPGFFSRFHIVQIPELDERDTLQVLVHAMRQMEARESVAFEPDALEATLALTRRFMPYQCNPGKTISLMAGLVSDYQNTRLDAQGRRMMTRERLVEFFAQQTGLPDFVLWEDRGLSWKRVHQHFQRRIIGQDAASASASDIVITLQQGLNDPSKPLATMLFVGPTGVGKTETAKALAEFLFGNKDRMIRFDMSEFRGPGSVARLFGDRFQPEGELTRKVEQSPFSVVLFDEIEKAHPGVFDAFLQVFGEGRLTNAAGRTTDFCNTILIMTSNLGVRQAQRSLGFGDSSGKTADAHFRKAAEQFFRPEFFNRIDRIVPFRALGRESMAPLVQRILTEILSRRGLRRSGVLVNVEQELVELLIDQGFNPRYGARSLRRSLEQRLTVPLARHLVQQPTNQTTLAQLFRRGDEIGMDILGLPETATTSQSVPLPKHWKALHKRHEVLKDRSTKLLQDPRLEEWSQRRSELLKRFNEDQLKDEQWGSLHKIIELLEGIRDIQGQLEDFNDNYLETFDYVEEFEIVVRVADAWDSGAKHTRPFPVVSYMPERIDKNRVFQDARRELDEMERKLAKLWFESDALQRPPETVLFRVMPATEDEEVVVWSVRVLCALQTAWGDAWGSTVAYEKAEGQWRKVDRLYYDKHDNAQLHHKLQGEKHQAFAVKITGPGVLSLVEGEEGYYMHSELSGPDQVCRMARVERVDLQGRDPLEALQGRDQSYEAFRLARIAGESLPNPRKRLEILRSYQNNASVDPLTGEKLDLQKSDHGLGRVYSTKILLAQMKEGAHRGSSGALEVSEASDAKL